MSRQTRELRVRRKVILQPRKALPHHQAVLQDQVRCQKTIKYRNHRVCTVQAVNAEIAAATAMYHAAFAGDQVKVIVLAVKAESKNVLIVTAKEKENAEYVMVQANADIATGEGRYKYTCA